MTDLAATLQTYGGWGISAVLLGILWRMVAYIEKLHSELRREASAAATIQREETRATVTALVETRDALRAFKDAMEALAEHLEK